MNTIQKILSPLAVLAGVLAVWSIMCVVTDSQIFPTPPQVLRGAMELAVDGSLWEHISASLLRVACGFGLAALLAIPLGLWVGRVESAWTALNPVFQILRPISPIAWIPIAILWFGVGDLSSVFLIFIAAVFPMIVQTAAGVHTIDQRFLQAAENFGVSRLARLRQVIIPAVLPDIIVGMRVGLGVAWLVVVAAEMIALHSGLGYLIMDSRNAGNRYDLVVAAMIVIGLIGLILDLAMRRLETMKSVRWRYGR